MYRPTRIKSQIRQPELPLPDWEEAGFGSAFGGVGVLAAAAGGALGAVSTFGGGGGVGGVFAFL